MKPTTLNAALAQHLATRPDAEFGRWLLGTQEEIITYQKLDDESARVAALLASRGIGPGDIVLIILPAGPQLWFSFLAALRLGAVPSFMPGPSAKQDPSRYWSAHATLFNRIGRGALLTHADHAAAIKAHVPEIPQSVIDLAASVHFAAPTVPNLAPAYLPRPGDIALLQHSSGTTGLKKGVALSHAAILRQLRSYAERLALTPADRIASWLPLYHDMGLIACFLLPLVTGVPVAMLDPFEWVAAPKRLFSAITRLRASLVWQPNFAFQHLCRTVRPDPAFDLTSVRAWINCSEPCRAETFAAFAQRFGPIGATPDRLQVCYAMAETVFAVTQTEPGATPNALHVATMPLRDERRIEIAPPSSDHQTLLSTGRVIAGLQIRITDPAGRPLPDRAVGAITIAGDCLFDGYHHLPDETARKLCAGWYHTGDLGFIHDGELYVTGRENDLIIVHGRNYYAHELEFLLNQTPGLHPGRNVAVGWFRREVGSEDVVVIAESIAATSIAAPDVIDRVKHTLLDGAGLHVFDVMLVPSGWLIKTTSGKIARGANLEKYHAARAGESLAPCPRAA